MKPNHRSIHYRPEIDGLRALAILPVVLFHANVAGFAGGYIGVDVFFVISGFLITSIIYRELSEDRFSLLTFWERRVRRIIPALVVVILSTLVAGYFIILYPIDYLDLGQSAIAQAAFFANLFFMRKNDYFAEPSETMPLLHTWSLSVEEQFYVGFPLLMLLLFKLGRRLILPIIAFIGVASLAYSYYLSNVAPTDSFSIPLLPAIWGGASNADAAFYLLLTRAFELLIGAALAIGAWSIARRGVAEVVSALGLGAIIYSVVFFSDTTPFPGIAALLPTLGAAAIILANTKGSTFVGNLLSFPIFIWVGLISYSLYLWHWPVLVLMKQYLNRALTNPEVMLAITLALLLSILTYRYVETPFRVKRYFPTRVPMVAAGLMALVFSGSVGYVIAQQQGFVNRAPLAAQSVAAATLDFGPRRSECFVNSFQGTDEPCLLGIQNPETVDFVLWGDSHAAALLPMIDEEARRRGLSGASFISAGCMPVYGFTIPSRPEQCERVLELAHTYIREHSIPQVLLVSRWSSFAELDHATTAPAAVVFESTFANTNEELSNAGAEIFIVKQVPHQKNFNVRALFYEASKTNSTSSLPTISHAEYREDHKTLHEILERLTTTPAVTLIDTSPLLCPQQEYCSMIFNNHILYQDSDHLNQTGAFYVAPAFSTFFNSFEPTSANLERAVQ